MEGLEETDLNEYSEQDGLRREHYKTISTWAKEIGLGAGGVLIAPQLIKDFSISDPVFTLGAIVSLSAYTLAFYWLKKS